MILHIRQFLGMVPDGCNQVANLGLMDILQTADVGLLHTIHLPYSSLEAKTINKMGKENLFSNEP
eukprot:m.108592 g.108592  ORF g.108592 m.108592 type:complete len:65 (-) comp9192_c0_seq2:65-259(-)